MTRSILSIRCVCGDDLPGHCPGPSACPYNQPDPPEPRVPRKGALIVFTYVELESGSAELSYAEWTEDGTPYSGYAVNPGHIDGEPIPDEIIAELARQIAETRKAAVPKPADPPAISPGRYIDFLTGKLVEAPPFDPTSGAA